MNVYISLFTDQDGKTILNAVSDDLLNIEQAIEFDIINNHGGARFETETFEYPKTKTVDLGDGGAPVTFPFNGHALIKRYTVQYPDGKTAEFAIYCKKGLGND